jgi:hypothetical protein
VIDFPRVIEVVRNHDLDEIPRGKMLSPVREARAVKVCVVEKGRPDRAQPAMVAIH